MNYPEFFHSIETIKLQDDLSNFLGTFEDGLVEFSYLDIVKAAGHSCPTVAGGYIMALVGLKKLYPNQLPKRGEILVSFKEDEAYGTAGVIANVITHITGATATTGFKGLNNKFKRSELMKFNQNISSSVKFIRIDSGKSVELLYDPTNIKQDPKIPILIQKIFEDKAIIEEKQIFGKLWQQRVENIFQNIDKVIREV